MYRAQISSAVVKGVLIPKKVEARTYIHYRRSNVIFTYWQPGSDNKGSNDWHSWRWLVRGLSHMSPTCMSLLTRGSVPVSGCSSPYFTLKHLETDGKYQPPTISPECYIWVLLWPKDNNMKTKDPHNHNEARFFIDLPKLELVGLSWKYVRGSLAHCRPRPLVSIWQNFILEAFSLHSGQKRPTM